MAEYKLIPASEIVPPALPVREAMDERLLGDLADSIRAVGLIQPLIVVPQSSPAVTPANAQPVLDDNCEGSPVPGYEIVAGHRRYLACNSIGLSPIPCVVFAEMSVALEAVKLHENLFREDITPAEEAIFYQELIEKYDLTEADLLRTVKQSENYVYARLNLFKGWPFVFDAIRERKIGLRVAQELNKVSDESHAKYLLYQATETQAGARAVSMWVADWKKQAMAPAGEPVSVAPLPAAQAPAPELFACAICGGNKDPYNLRTIYVHHWEFDLFRKLVERAASEFVAAQGQQPG